MRKRAAAPVIVLALTLTGCSGGSGSLTPGGTTGATGTPAATIAATAATTPAATVGATASSAGSARAGSGGAANKVGAEESEFKIVLAAPSAAAGPVTFAVKNVGTIAHQFVVVSTDLKADKLPLKGSKADEDATKLIDEKVDIAPGKTTSLKVNLKRGHYVVLCNLPGHYVGGMHADFDVK